MALINPYAARLQEFPGVAFNDQDSFQFQNTWQKHFSDRMSAVPARTVLEIGCSNADFLTAIASQNLDAAFVGIDWKFKVIYKGAKKVHVQNLKNVTLLRSRAQDLLRVFGQNEVDEIWIFFPDPWAKKSQLKNRLLQEKFLLEADRALKPGGKIYFKTDHPGYFQWVLSLFNVPHPELPNYDSEEPLEKSRRAKQIKVRRLEKDDLPSPSEASQSKFHVEKFSANYWNEPHPKTLFSETQTLFEKLFVKDGLPIYYVEIFKR